MGEHIDWFQDFLAAFLAVFLVAALADGWRPAARPLTARRRRVRPRCAVSSRLVSSKLASTTSLGFGSRSDNALLSLVSAAGSGKSGSSTFPRTSSRFSASLTIL